MKKFSIIIPVYNIEKYIDETINSILSQKYTDFELIVIDDGSKDNSGKICDKYKKDAKVKIVHQQNAGVSAARNKGLELATGDYILFVDGDDYLEKNALSTISENLNDNDMVIYSFREKYIKKSYQKKVTENIKKENNYEVIKKVLSNQYGGYIFNKVFKKSIIDKRKIRFDRNIHMCEDMVFVLEYLQFSKDIIFIPDMLYNYRMRKTSAVWQKNEKYMTIFEAYENIRKLLMKNNLSDEELNYKIAFSYCLLKKTQREIVEKKYNFNFKSYIKNNKSIKKDLKIKLFILKNLKFVYCLYMLVKTKSGKRYE